MEEITTEEQKKYWDIFISLNPINGYLSGDQAAKVLRNSKLSNEKLEKIWNLADIDKDGNLDFEEFCISMRLIFDVINKVYLEVPSRLPDFLIPTSKAHLIVAQEAIYENEQNAHLMQKTNKTKILSDNFDWYIQPSDKQNYEAIYSSNADLYGNISFNTLRNFYAILDISEEELRNAWKLVNPKMKETIEKDQAFYFLHILNQRNKGIRVPSVVPANLRATFEKNPVDYNINEVSSYKNDHKNAIFPQSSKHTSPVKKYDSSKEMHATYVEDSNMDGIRQKRQEIHYQGKKYRSDGSDEHISHNIILAELEQMLEFKKNELKLLKEGNIKSVTGMNDLESVQSDVLVMKQQIDNLGSYLIKKTDELQKLRSDIRQET
ncbi:hypothetical protein PNEG_00976 [Pneumocystis murina B123]|uniref:Endocytosis protein 3 n=1 Tax=Pneumocystis murina (strain B123) TaxID=1069680 RepID=M7PAG4_PNEMU|nr:hypothetical protein PNEG_00976 [Pneumocystis murina B123]EMR10830.1 hypothetical protein PNEG_00976 [Pneumocystis murina B123]